MATIKKKSSNSENLALNPALLVSGASYSKKNRQTKNIKGWERKVTYGYQKENKKEKWQKESYDYRDERNRE